MSLLKSCILVQTPSLVSSLGHAVINGAGLEIKNETKTKLYNTNLFIFVCFVR